MKLHEMVTTGDLSGAEIPKRYLVGVIRRKLCGECGFNLIKKINKMKLKKRTLKFCPECGELIKWS